MPPSPLPRLRRRWPKPWRSRQRFGHAQLMGQKRSKLRVDAGVVYMIDVICMICIHIYIYIYIVYIYICMWYIHLIYVYMMMYLYVWYIYICIEPTCLFITLATSLTRILVILRKRPVRRYRILRDLASFWGYKGQNGEIAAIPPPYYQTKRQMQEFDQKTSEHSS